MAKQFAQFLQEQPALHVELSDEMQAVVAACIETGRKGQITLKVTIAPQKDGVTYQVTTDLQAKKPRAERTPALFFADDAGNLLRSDPRQLAMTAVREVPKPEIRETPAPVASVADATPTNAQEHTA